MLNRDELATLCRSARRRHTEISDVVAREIAAMFGGLSADACVFIANGAVPRDADVLWDELFPGYEGLDSTGKLFANCMYAYLDVNTGRGPVDGWRQ